MRVVRGVVVRTLAFRVWLIFADADWNAGIEPKAKPASADTDAANMSTGRSNRMACAPGKNALAMAASRPRVQNASTTASTDLYAYGAPTVSLLSPDAGSVAGGNTVTINGTGFVPGATRLMGSPISPWRSSAPGRCDFANTRT